MTAKNLQSIKAYLEESGFVQDKGSHTYRWDGDVRSFPSRLQMPWKIADWSIELGGQRALLRNFSAQIQRDHLLQNLEDLLKPKFPAYRTAIIQDDSKSGFWLLFEFLDKNLEADQSRLIEDEITCKDQLPHGLAGIHITAIQALSQFTIFMTRHFFLGNVPSQLFMELPRALNMALFGEELKDKSHFNAYVCTIDSEDVRYELMRASQLPDAALQILKKEEARSGLPLQAHFRSEESAWKLEWMPGEELPDLVVPPIEVLEQKEVARRFQRLDELVLLEDYQGAMEQCRSYLASHPQSLYLIRRWAFLCLWAGHTFEQDYLDVMSKYDPDNLMTLSLWIKKGLQISNPDILLANLSKLGNTLGQCVADFDDLDITSLTLPEMLGDAWNQKDDQRAVACYERVLHTRGEIPRILVKLIRLMRDIDDPHAEEGYMDRLLVCEVPTRTRAAIYYRLAEIKQSSHREEACQWALKSWQTNRNQVRYALLAADLLILLGRAQDAVHVLVETSELMTDAEPMESRLQLEMRIATVWHENMHRLDLAAERIGRARELAGDDPQAYDSILQLVQKMNEPELLSAIVQQGLAAADHSGDQERKAKFVQMLLDLAEEMGESSRAVELFTLILSTTLLNVNYTFDLLSKENLNLPFDQIISAMERLIDNLDEQERTRYYQMLGDLCHAREEPKTLYFYEKALHLGSLTQLSFEFLDEHYSRNGMNAQRYALLQKKFHLANENERVVILRELYYFDEGVSHQERDGYALQIFVSDADDIGPLEERVHAYEKEGDGEAVVTLISKAVQASPVNPVLISLVRMALDIVSGIENENKYPWLIQLLSKLRELGEDSFELARLTVQYLRYSPEKNWIKGPLELLVSRGAIPDMQPGELLELIDNESLRVDLLLQLADRSADFEETLAYEREALRIARDLPYIQAIKMEIRQRLASKIPFTLDEFREYIKDVRSSGKDQMVLKVISHQFRMAKDPEFISELLTSMTEFLHMAPLLGEDREPILLAIQGLPREQGNPLKMVWLERFGFEGRLHSLDFAKAIFADRKQWKRREQMCLLVKNLARSEAVSISSMVNAFVTELAIENNMELLREYFTGDEMLSLLEKDEARRMMDLFVNSPDGAYFDRLWWQYLLKLSTRAEVQEFLTYSRQIYAQLSRHVYFFERLANIGDHPQVQAVVPEVLAETRFFFANYLLENGRDRRKALNIFESLWNQYPQDTRLWGALIVLYREFQEESDLYELLHRILPSLRVDSQPLQKHHISLHSLQEDLSQIGHRMGLIFADGSEGTKSTIDFRPDSDSRLGPSGTFLTNAADIVKQDTRTSFEVGNNDSTVIIGDMRSFTKENLLRSEPTEPGTAFNHDEEKPMHTVVASLPEVKEDDGFFTMKVVGSEDFPAIPFESETVASRRLHVAAIVTDHIVVPPEDSEEPKDEVETLPDPELNAVQQFDPQAWRLSSRDLKAPPGLTASLLAKPLPDLAEQTMALQVSALLEDRLPLLEKWTHCIWRRPQDVFFELRWSDRMSKEMSHPGIKAPLARLMKSLSPLFRQQFSSAMGLLGIAERLKLRVEDILRSRKLLEWQDEVVQRGNLRFYAKYLTDNGFHLYHLPKLEDRFHFDFEKKDVYIDRNHLLEAPPSHFFQRLAFLIRAVSLDFYPFLNLSPGNDIYPFLMKCRRSLESSQSDNFKRILGMEKDPLKLSLAQIKDKDQLALLFKEVGTLSPDKVAKTVSCFVDQIYRLNLAETLDLIGSIEAISNLELLDGKNSSLQVINQSATAKALVAFAGELRFQK